MASVRALKTVWQLRFYDADRTPQTTTNSVPKEAYTRAEAEREADWREQLYERGMYDPWRQDHPHEAATAAASEQLTVLEAVNDYIQAKREAGRRGEAGGWTANTYKETSARLRSFARDVGANRLVQHLDKQDMTGWIYTHELAHATKRGRWVRIMAMLRYWHEQQWIEEMPDMPGRPEKRQRLRTTLTVDQLETLCDAHARMNAEKVAQNKHTTTAGTPWHTDAWRACFYQGFRRSEVLSLRVRNVWPDEQMIQIGDKDYRQKGKRETLIPLVDEGADVLAPYLDKERDAYVFPGSPKTDKVSRRFRATVDYACARDLLDVDPEAVNFYTLRHSCCTHWLREGKPLIWVNALMRHAQIETTMEYVHLLPTDLRSMYQL